MPIAASSPISNTAKITEINGKVFSSLDSDSTYHTISNPVVNVHKVNSKGEPLEGAELEILNSDGTAATLRDKNGNEVSNAFSSAKTPVTYHIAPGSYILRETAVPKTFYKIADDIHCRITQDGYGA